MILSLPFDFSFDNLVAVHVETSNLFHRGRFSRRRRWASSVIKIEKPFAF